MNLNTIVFAVLGFFIIAVSLRLVSSIESSLCSQKESLKNMNRFVLIVGSVLFVGSVTHLLCKSCDALSDMFLIFNMVLGIVSIVLFSLLSKNLKNCNLDSKLSIVGILLGLLTTGLPLFIFGKRFFQNRENFMNSSMSPNRVSLLNVSSERVDAPSRPRSMSPNRVSLLNVSSERVAGPSRHRSMSPNTLSS